MTLTGTYTRTLDDKNRLAVPKRLREQLGDEDLKSLFVTPETNHSLGLYSPEAFERFARRLEEHASNSADYRNYLRLFYARAEEVELDSQGRIRIPDRLVDFGRLRHDLVLLGVQDHAEIWDQELWNGFLDQHGPNFDEMATRAFE